MSASVKIEFDDGSRVIARELAADAVRDVDRVECPPDEYYDVAGTVAFIQQRRAKRVALQFPDHLLPDAPHVLGQIQVRQQELASPAPRVRAVPLRLCVTARRAGTGGGRCPRLPAGRHVVWRVLRR